MVPASKLDALRERLQAFDPQYYQTYPLPKMQSLLEGSIFPSQPSQTERWQQDDLYCLYHLPRESSAFVREQLSAYQKISLDTVTDDGKKLTYRVSAKDYYLAYATRAMDAIEALKKTGHTDPVKLKAVCRAQMECIYMIFAAIKNFLLFQEIRMKFMPSCLGKVPDDIIAETNLIQQEMASVQQDMIQLVGDAGSRLLGLEHTADGIGLFVELKQDIKRLDGLLVTELLKRSVFSDLGASKLQSAFMEMQLTFDRTMREQISYATIFSCLSWMPCVSNPLRDANQKLEQMKLVILDGSQESAWATLGLFLEVWEETKDYPEYAELLKQCATEAFTMTPDMLELEVRNIAAAHVAAYEQSQMAPSASFLQEREMKQMGYHRLN